MAGRATLTDWKDAARFARTAAPAVLRRYNRQRRSEVLPAPFTPHPKRWPDTGLHAAWLGHSTVLLKVDGFTIITDPVLSEKCGVGVGPLTVGLKRLVEPALDTGQLPRIDLILLSHAHFDHFDRRTLRMLESRGTSVVTASARTIPGSTCTATRSRHGKWRRTAGRSLSFRSTTRHSPSAASHTSSPSSAASAQPAPIRIV
jgi:hypothetical protein